MTEKWFMLGDCDVCYLIGSNKKVSFFIIPHSCKKHIKRAWEAQATVFSPSSRYIRSWQQGNLAYYFTEDDDLERPGVTMRRTEQNLFFSDQRIERTENSSVITTEVTNNAGVMIIHRLIHINGRKGYIIETEFVNTGDKSVSLEYLTSFSMDNLSPFQSDDAPGKYKFHRFMGGWSMEGRHVSTPIEELGLEKSWAGFYGPNEKFGCMGSYPVEKYFPTAILEDIEYNVKWAVQIECGSTWQMELTREGDTLSLSGGLGDNDFCGWKKTIKPGESFKAPRAYISSVCGDISETCAALTDMHKDAYDAQNEEKLSVCFNEYCTSWGKPTQEKVLGYCRVLKSLGVKYLVIDAGWCNKGKSQMGNGEWLPDKSIFPDMKAMCKKIRENGLIPGIWFEFEVTTDGSLMFESKYDDMHLKRNGRVIKNRGCRSYWDFRRSDVREYLHDRVIDFLRENGFGYIKVDYNDNIGIGVDGADSPSEGIREHISHVRDFFLQMKKEIPDLIIENCAAGGHRLEPSMLGVSAMSSVSDAHEAVEIPYIAANMHNLCLPVQSLIWSVLHPSDSRDRMVYSLCAAFLGRMCLSGELDALSAEQVKIVKEAIDFYGNLDNILKNGVTRIYGNRSRIMRYPKGTQVVVRQNDKYVLVIVHSFEEPGEDIEVELEFECVPVKDFQAHNTVIKNNVIEVKKMKAFQAEAVLLKRKGI